MQNYRIRANEMQQAILPIKAEKTILKPRTITTLAFTILGGHDILIDEAGIEDGDGYPALTECKKNGKIIAADSRPTAFAKKVIGTQKIRYFIKTNSLGRFYNPMDMYKEGKHNKELRHAGKNEWEYREVGYPSFKKYIEFLKTRNLAWLRNAEREAF